MDNCVLEIIVGTYEEFLIGYQLKIINGTYTFEQSFTNHAHTSSVRSLSASAKFVASGGVDETIHVFNMRKRNEFGRLIQQHNGTITHMEFYGNNNLFTSSDDGTVCIWDTKTWECEKTLRGHKDAVNCISVHPSGKMLLSVSKDKTLRTWNLIKGRCAYVTNLKSVSHFVLWSEMGSYFTVVIEKKVDVYDISIGGVIYSIDFGKRVNCVAFLNNTTLIIGGDFEEISIYDIENKSLINSFRAHENRIKSLKCVKNIPSIKESNKIWLITCSSDSFVKLWEIDMKNLKSSPELMASVNTMCRLTCLSVWIPEEENTDELTKLKSESGKKRKKVFKENSDKKSRQIND